MVEERLDIYRVRRVRLAAVPCNAAALFFFLRTGGKQTHYDDKNRRNEINVTFHIIYFYERQGGAASLSLNLEFVIYEY